MCKKTLTQLNTHLVDALGSNARAVIKSQTLMDRTLTLETHNPTQGQQLLLFLQQSGLDQKKSTEVAPVVPSLNVEISLNK